MKEMEKEGSDFLVHVVDVCYFMYCSLLFRVVSYCCSTLSHIVVSLLLLSRIVVEGKRMKEMEEEDKGRGDSGGGNGGGGGHHRCNGRWTSLYDKKVLVLWVAGI